MSVDLTKESDASLMLLIGAASPSSAEDQTLAREALQVLHARHYGYLLGVLEAFADNVGTVVIDPKEFATRTFVKAFRAAKTFCDMSDGDPAKADALFKAWLGTIAANLARDELNRIKRLNKNFPLVVLDETHDTPVESEADGDPTPTEPEARAALETVLATLKPEEQDILITYANFGIPTESGRELPKDVRDALEERTGYERSNIRQKWNRLSKRLRDELKPLIKNQKYPSSCQTKLQNTQPTR